MKLLHIFLLLLNLYESVKYSPERLLQHRKIMAKAFGVPVIKYNTTHN